nr:DUF1376 domain-containing protein [uncultured Allomuricauda sp.]
MTKDPAFLFYPKDYYEGTRMMLPEERACYMDLLIYQHQHGGIIPNDLKRLTMYCSGCDISTIQNVLDQKFNQTEDGWFNQKLEHLVNERSMGKPKKIASACFAGLISSSKLNKKQVIFLKKRFQILDFIKDNDILIIDETLIKTRVREWFNKMLNQMVENLANVNANVNANRNNGKGGAGEKPIALDEVVHLDLIKTEISNSIQWQEGLCRTYRISLVEIQEWLNKFHQIIWDDGEVEKSIKEYKKHFNRWLGIQIKTIDKKESELKNKTKKRLEKYGG